MSEIPNGGDRPWPQPTATNSLLEQTIRREPENAETDWGWFGPGVCVDYDNRRANSLLFIR